MTTLQAIPHATLRRRLARRYTGHSDVDQSSRGMVLPATVAPRVVIKLENSPYRPPEFVSGARDSHVAIDGACAPSYIEVALAPLGAYSLLGVPLDDLGPLPTDLTDIAGRRGRALADELRDVTSWDRRFAVLDAHLRRWAASSLRPTPQVVRAWELLVRSGGTARVREIARDVGWSHKHLIARFRRQVGLNPKAAARVIRGTRAVTALTSTDVELGRLAHDSGYADQAHLSREVVRLTGRTPTQLREASAPSG